jgi:hypothetical protein
MPFVFAFIAFNVLDLDGSNLAALTKYFDRVAIDADVAAAPEVVPLPERVESRTLDHFIGPCDESDNIRFKTAVDRAISRLEISRSHLYHVSLPRDSVPG